MNYEKMWYQLKNTLILRKRTESEKRDMEYKSVMLDFVREIMDNLESKHILREDGEEDYSVDLEEV